MKDAIDALDAWLRGEFRELNTYLEQAYFDARCVLLTGLPELDRYKEALLRQGSELAGRLAIAASLPAEPSERYALLGMVGYVLAACRRHEIDIASSRASEPLAAAWSIASQIGTSLGVAPRYVFAHQALYNRARGGSYQTFTTLPDERVFIEGNALAVLAYQRAAQALRRVMPLGVSHPVAGELLLQADAALVEVLERNQNLARTLDVDRFFFNIRPYFKTHRVGNVDYRGANAGDFAAVSEIDLYLGVCSAADSFYQAVLAEKAAYVPPEDHGPLQAAVRCRPLLDQFLDEARDLGVTPQLRANGKLFLAVCRSHGAAYAYHHNKLVKPFLELPAQATPVDRQANLTASGPPLSAVIAMLQRLSDLRSARDRLDIGSAAAKVSKLRDLVR